MTDEGQIRALVATWADATRKGDITTVLSLMTDDVIFLVVGRQPMARAEFEAASVSMLQNGSNKPVIEASQDIMDIKIVGDLAYMWTHMRVTLARTGGATDAAKIVRSGHTLSVLRKESGKWLLCRDANMLTLEN